MRTRVALSLIPVIAAGAMGCLEPAPGRPLYQDLGRLSLPKSVSVNVMGGNLMLAQDDLSIDTRLGTRMIRRTFNSGEILGQKRTWRFNFETTYDGSVFVAPDGAVYDVTGLSGVARIAGSQWVRLSATRVKTLGGLVYEFSGGRLLRIFWHGEEGARYLQMRSAFIAGRSRITGIDQCLSGACDDVYTIGHDANGRIDEVTDRAMRRAEYTYDAEGRLSSARDGLDVARGWSGFVYSYTDNSMSITNSEGESYTVTFDGKSRPKRIEYHGEGNPAYAFQYGWSSTSSPAYFTNVTDPLGNVTTYRYYQNRRLAAIDHPLNESEYFAWGTGEYAFEVTQHRYPTHDVTYQYTSGGDHVFISDPQNGSRSIFYEPLSGKESNFSNPMARPMYLVNDGTGTTLLQRAWYGTSNGFRLQYVENGEGERTTYSYDADGNVSSINRGGVVTTLANYGEHGHPGTESVHATSFNLGYDDVGNLLYDTRPSVDSLGVEAWPSYDEDRNRVQWRLSSSDYITASYRSDHQMTSIQRPFGGNTTFGYDVLGRRTSQTELVAATETSVATPRTSTWEYTLRGQTAASTLPNGMRNEWVYDERGRVLSSLAKRHWTTESSTYNSYNSRGQLASTVSGVGPAFAEFYRYDSRGHVSRVDFTNGEYVTLDYDQNGLLSSRRYYSPSGSQIIRISQVYDSAQREIRLIGDGRNLIRTDWGDFGKNYEVFGNGMTRNYYYTSTGDLAETFTDSSIADDTYCPESGGVVEDSNCGSIFNDCQFGFSKSWSTQTWTRNCIRRESNEEAVIYFPETDRLTSWADEQDNRQYEWDALSNLTRIVDNNTSQDVSTFVYNATRNRLLRIDRSQASSRFYEYDEAGFVTSRGGETYTWTARGQPSQRGAYTMDWDPYGRLRQVSLSGVPLKIYRFGGDMEYDSLGNPIALDLGRVRILLDGSGMTYYRHLDHRGNVKFTTSDPPSGAANVLQQYSYGPFGLVGLEGDASDFSHRFAGGMALGGVVLLGARSYDQDAGRFLAPDPIPQVVNQYTYAMGNPVDFWDPGGLEPAGLGAQRFLEVGTGGGQAMNLYRQLRDGVLTEFTAGPEGKSFLVSGGFIVLDLFVAPVLVSFDLGTFLGERINGQPSLIPDNLDVLVETQSGFWYPSFPIQVQVTPIYVVRTRDIEPKGGQSVGGGLP